MRDRAATHAPSPRRDRPAIAYVIKGYPRLSELFIASEIHRLEQAGLRLRLFVIKRGDDAVRHPTVDRIQALPEYLPATASVSATPLWHWLRQHLPLFAGALVRTIRRWPRGVVRAAGAAAAQAVRARNGFWAAPRKVYVKEFLQAVAVADRLRDAPEVKHLHAHFCHGATTVAWLAAMMAGRTFSFTAHAKDLYTPSLNPAGLLRRKLAAARFAVTCTEANRDVLLRQAGITPVFRVYHGLNAEFADLMTRELAAIDARWPSAALRIVSVGRHVHKKGFDVLIAACADLVRRGIAVEAAIIGERGDATHAIAAAIDGLGISRQVRLLGPMSQAELFAALRSATVFCLPCRVGDDGDRDGIPNVLVEAMATGLPVVTTGVSGIPELVEHEVTGLVVDAENARQTADALLRIHRDPALAGRLAANARAVVNERFASWSRSSRGSHEHDETKNVARRDAVGDADRARTPVAAGVGVCVPGRRRRARPRGAVAVEDHHRQRPLASPAVGAAARARLRDRVARSARRPDGCSHRADRGGARPRRSAARDAQRTVPRAPQH
jgi:glycosyltransferase involved in cell wall biosynthesis